MGFAADYIFGLMFQEVLCMSLPSLSVIITLTLCVFYCFVTAYRDVCTNRYFICTSETSPILSLVSNMLESVNDTAWNIDLQFGQGYMRKGHRQQGEVLDNMEL